MYVTNQLQLFVVQDDHKYSFLTYFHANSISVQAAKCSMETLSLSMSIQTKIVEVSNHLTVNCEFVLSSICLSVCARFKSRKYSSDVLKFMDVIHISDTAWTILKMAQKNNDSSTETHKSLRPMVWGISKAYLNLFILH